MESVHYLSKKRWIKLFVIYILFFTFSLDICNFSSIQTISLNNFTDISVSEAYNLTENTSNLFILDVRTQEANLTVFA